MQISYDQNSEAAQQSTCTSLGKKAGNLLQIEYGCLFSEYKFSFSSDHEKSFYSCKQWLVHKGAGARRAETALGFEMRRLDTRLYKEKH
ncbi:hypothetical protein VNO77_33784 [Canavalia gladiata]|uniref:Uncharacterized protein n=1 Tax=Canavalia gladiata TaxID=3824 RepID=A0AAN9KFJ2_CANGL